MAQHHRCRTNRFSFLWRATIWQNSIRQLMEMEPVETTYPCGVALIACLTSAFLILAARGFQEYWRFVHRLISRLVPRRVSYVLSMLIIGVILLLLVNHVLAKIALDIADAVFLEMDEVVDENIEQPTDGLAFWLTHVGRGIVHARCLMRCMDIGRNFPRTTDRISTCTD
jgi:uncharacterized membrane protein